MKLLLLRKIIVGLSLFFMMAASQAAMPLWSFIPDPNFPNQITVLPGSSAIVKYVVQNNTKRTKILFLLNTFQGAITQVEPCILAPAKGSICILTLAINGNLLPPKLDGGPFLCELGNPQQCYQPLQPEYQLHIQKPLLFSVGGNISGLMNELVLLINNVEYRTNTDGTFSTAPFLPNGSPYTVSVLSQPTYQTCTVNNPAGIINGANVTNVLVTCNPNFFTLSGVLSNPSGTPVNLTDGTSNAPITITNGNFTFPYNYAAGSSYNVMVLNSAQTCTVTNGVGTFTSNVTNVQVRCDTPVTINGLVTGLFNTNRVNVLLNDQILRIVTGASPTFSYEVANGAAYSITANNNPAFACVPQPSCMGTASASSPSCIINCIPRALTTLSSPTQKTIVPVIPAGFANIIVNNNTTNPAYNVRAVLPTGWTGVVQTGCPAVLAGGASCILQLNSNIPYVAQSIPIVADNLAPFAPLNVAVAFSLNNFLVWQTDMIDPNTIVSQVIDNTDIAQIRWGKSGIQIGAADFFNGFQNTALINASAADVSPAAAVACFNSTVGGTPPGSWYLPAVCQLGGINLTALCGNAANVNDNLVRLGFDVGLANNQTSPSVTVGHWSSTESNGTQLDCLNFTTPQSPINCAYVNFFQLNAQTFQFSFQKEVGGTPGVFTMLARCTLPVTTTIP
ncbi:MAG: hypothetical protein H0U57_09500 [Tatlockia sp.]|nr:hypothetical protein [Tatlockia sp.]